MKPWYEKLFANYARTYDKEGYTQGTLQETMMNDGMASTQMPYIRFDVATLRTRSILKAVDDSGCKMTFHCNERYFMPSELRWMLQTLGFKDIGILGCTVGKFSRKVKPSSGEFELLAIAAKNS